MAAVTGVAMASSAFTTTAATSGAAAGGIIATVGAAFSLVVTLPVALGVVGVAAVASTAAYLVLPAASLMPKTNVTRRRAASVVVKVTHLPSVCTWLVVRPTLSLQHAAYQKEHSALPPRAEPVEEDAIQVASQASSCKVIGAGKFGDIFQVQLEDSPLFALKRIRKQNPPQLESPKARVRSSCTATRRKFLCSEHWSGQIPLSL